MSFKYRSPLISHLFSLLLTSFSVALFTEATTNTITQGQLVRDGQTIISAGQNFMLGFFSPENSALRYVGIWYYRISEQTVVWVANRDNPISGFSGVLTIGNYGNLVVLDGNSSVVWSTNPSSPSFNSTTVLMDNGNLILYGSQGTDGTNRTLWQSFNDPTDTYLPNMRAYMNARRGESHAFASWTSKSNPLLGNYTMGLDPRGSPQIVIWEESKRRWRSGHWNGLIFTGVPSMRALYLYGFRLTSEEDGEMYFTYSMLNDSCTMRFRLRWDGIVEQLIWINENTQWNVTLSHPSNECEFYNKCGNFGLCRLNSSPICSCMRGFEPKNKGEWNSGNWTSGCIRRTALQCGGNGIGDRFLEVKGVKLADYADTLVAEDKNVCEDECLKNCSCNAYTFVPGIGCMIWSGDLVDVEYFDDGGKSLFIRLANSEFGGESIISKAVVITIAVLGTIFLGASIWILYRVRKRIKAFSKAWRKNKKSLVSDLSRSREFLTDYSEPDELSIDGKNGNGPQLPLCNFNVIEVATDNFANKNKLGQGGFGPVYKGTLPGGLEIAVKRLSKSSGQGLEEFKNEMILISKLQHRNLVRVLGCCIEGDEKLLVYEYMPNKSLDSFLFDTAMKAQLDWSKRFAIIMGIARGLIYLHRDSRLRIIHRDLKASNILLDGEMNPKISDFGTARIFGGNQNEANTNRVIGTYGYMSPEYAMEGLFSVKSDVYSFGVLLLEIVSGQRNTSFGTPESSNLIRHAWDLWNDGKVMELIDPSIAYSCSKNEVLQCIHVGMLCVQVSAVYRPTMSSVVLMLEGDNVNLPKPKQLDISWMSSADIYSFMQGHETLALNEETVTDLSINGR